LKGASKVTRKPKILSIEDEKGIQEGLDYILSDFFDLEFADNGTEGMKRALRSVPDLILLDLKMPGMDGFQVCKILREDSEFDDVPIIVISAFNNPADRKRAFELGADDYITKPFDGEELIARIQRKLNIGGSSSSLKTNSLGGK
jgi:DNA-binding response OmpR family regulator